MKRTFKKILCTLLVVVMCLTCAPLQGFVGLDWSWLDFSVKASAATEGYYTYEIKNGEATITDVNTSISGDITIPATLGGYSVTTIGDYAFDFCDNLKSVTIPDSVTTIGDYAFNDCDSLTSVTIPDSVTTIGAVAFAYCYSLTSIVVDINNSAYSNDSRGALFDKNKTMLIQYPRGNTGTSYTIPDSVTTIGMWAFYSCDSLTSVTIPDSVTTIGLMAFAHCDSLTSVTIPDSVTTIGDYAFAHCDSLTDVYYKGTEEQWKEMSIGLNNDDLLNATIYYHTHAYTSQNTTPATHLSEGVRTYTCGTCGDSYTEAIAKTKEHNYNTVSKIVAPTCEKEGYTVYVCECGHTYNGDKKAATGHNYSGDTCVDCGKKCSCNCHKSGFMGLIWKIILFFNKLFKTNKTCACGLAHY